MNKQLQREVQKATNFAATHPAFAAATLAPLMRSCSNRDFPKLMQVMNDLRLRDHMEVVNGCYVAKTPS